MRALVCHGTTLTLERDYPHPTPVTGEALIRVLKAGICNTDWRLFVFAMHFTDARMSTPVHC